MFLAIIKRFIYKRALGLALKRALMFVTVDAEDIVYIRSELLGGHRPLAHPGWQVWHGEGGDSHLQ